MGTTNSCLIELKDVLGTVNQAMEPRVDSAIATILNQYSLSMHSKYSSLYTDKYISHLSSMKLLCATDRDHYRKMQVVKMQRITDCLWHSPDCYIYRKTQNGEWNAVNAKGP